MSTQWKPVLVEARPPSRPRRWEQILLVVCLVVASWAPVLVIAATALYLLGWWV